MVDERTIVDDNREFLAITQRGTFDLLWKTFLGYPLNNSYKDFMEKGSKNSLRICGIIKILNKFIQKGSIGMSELLYKEICDNYKSPLTIIALTKYLESNSHSIRLNSLKMIENVIRL